MQSPYLKKQHINTTKKIWLQFLLTMCILQTLELRPLGWGAANRYKHAPLTTCYYAKIGQSRLNHMGTRRGSQIFVDVGNLPLGMGNV